MLVSTLGALDSAVEMKIPQAILPSLIGWELMPLLTGLEPDGVIAYSVFSNEPDCVPPVQISAVEIIYI